MIGAYKQYQNIIYPIGLFIGLKWKGTGALVCIVSMVAYMVVSLSYLPVNFTFPPEFFIFWTVLFLIQITPETFYILSSYYHRD